jgi:hypothetical protein
MTHINVRHTELFTFLISISLGFWIGSRLGQKNIAPVRVVPAHAQTSIPLPSLPDGERIILVIDVDSLDLPQPQLQSLWLVTYYLDGKPIQWLPIFPSGESPMPSTEHDLFNSFKLESNEDRITPSSEFFTWLEDNNYWLSGYLLLDDVATAAIINLIGDIPTSLTPEENQFRQRVPALESQPTSPTQQGMLLSRACRTLALQSMPPNWHLLLNLIPEHIVTDLDPEQLIKEILTITAPDTSWHCEFPTITTLP